MDKPLDNEQLAKRVAWLDSEHRNDKTIIATLQSKLETLETENTKLKTRLNELESETTRIKTLMARVESFEQDMTNLRTETNRQFDGFKDSLYEMQAQAGRRNNTLDGLSGDLIDIRKKIRSFQDMDIESGFKKQADEDIRLARMNEEMKAEINEISEFTDEYRRSLKMLDETRLQDTKRVTDIQGEIASLRKRYDETRAKQELASDSMRKLENRFRSLAEAESERREAQNAFFEKINLTEVDRARIFKHWAERFEHIEQITENIEEKIESLENINRSVKESQANLDEVTQRFERRINEITEVQRLNEDRFRQEWTTFKADDQKRWSNYVISQDEQHREMNRNMSALGDRISNIDDELEIIQDNLHQFGKEEIKRMQTTLNSMRESLDLFNTLFKD